MRWWFSEFPPQDQKRPAWKEGIEYADKFRLVSPGQGRIVSAGGKGSPMD